MDHKINCIITIRKIRDKQYHDIKNKDNAEIVEYFRNKDREINKELGINRDEKILIKKKR